MSELQLFSLFYHTISHPSTFPVPEEKDDELRNIHASKENNKPRKLTKHPQPKYPLTSSVHYTVRTATLLEPVEFFPYFSRIRRNPRSFTYPDETVLVSGTCLQRGGGILSSKVIKLENKQGKYTIPTLTAWVILCFSLIFIRFFHNPRSCVPSSNTMVVLGTSMHRKNAKFSLAQE